MFVFLVTHLARERRLRGMHALDMCSTSSTSCKALSTLLAGVWALICVTSQVDNKRRLHGVPSRAQVTQVGCFGSVCGLVALEPVSQGEGFAAVLADVGPFGAVS